MAACTAGAVFLALCLLVARRQTPTIDEFAHVPAGCVYWKQGAFDLYGKNPPLLKLWMTIPVVADSRVTVPRFSGNPLGWGPWEYGRRFMDANRDRYLGLYFRARAMVALLGLACGALVFVWTRRLFGTRAAAVSASLFLLSPPVLAHASLATVDTGCMLTILTACWLARRACLRSDVPSVALAGAALGVALSVKFTALLVVPALVALLAWRRPGEGAGGRARFVRWARDAAVLLVAALLVVHAAFGFKGSFRRLDAYRFHSRTCLALQSALPGALPVPLPRDWLSGFDAVRLDTEKGEFDNYLLGEWSAKGWWYYDLVTLAVKVPIPLLLLALAGAALWRREAPSGIETWAVVLPLASVLLFMSAFNRVNTGIRYVLPVLPFLHVAAGAVFAERAGRGRARWRDGLAALAIVLGLGTAAVASRDPLAWFNAIAGGPSRGHEWLIDSNLDWGQDLYRVRAEAERLKPGEPIALLYCGHADPDLYGLRYLPLPPGPVEDVVAVSVNYLVGMKYPAVAPGGSVVWVKPDHVAWLRGLEPVARLGSIWVFDTRSGSAGRGAGR